MYFTRNGTGLSRWEPCHSSICDAKLGHGTMITSQVNEKHGSHRETAWRYPQTNFVGQGLFVSRRISATLWANKQTRIAQNFQIRMYMYIAYKWDNSERCIVFEFTV